MSKLSKAERLTRLQKSYSKIGVTTDMVDQSLSREITHVERELGFPIYGNYPLMKFLQQCEDLQYIIQQENKQ